MKKAHFYPMAQALLAAALFGASAPFAKLLLGEIEPVVLAAFLYLGSGLGLLTIRALQRINGRLPNLEARINRQDLPWLFGATLAGGVAAPIVLMFSLQHTPAATASMLLNFEGVATTLIAVIAFKEAIGRRIWFAILSITGASILLSWETNGMWGISLGALGVLIACGLWGIDNNFTRNISAKDPLIITTIKGLVAGTFSLILALLLHNPFPTAKITLVAMLLGSVSYGLSITLFILAMRGLGAARTSAFFGVAPYIGVILALLLLREIPNFQFVISLPLMIIGAILLLSEEHSHLHSHEMLEHEHRHDHDDMHHNHEHQKNEEGLVHSHWHKHPTLIHSHAHTPDIHHRHEHEQ